MFDLDKWQEIFQTITKNKVRTFATAFGVFWGILMLILLLGAGQGLQNGVQQSMLLDAINSIWVIPARTSISYEGMPAGRQHPFQEEDLESVFTEVSGIEFMSPENWLMGNYIVKYKNRGSAFGVYGTKSDYFDIKVTMKIQSGRSLNLLDDREKRKVCYIGNRVAESIFPEGVDPVGEYLDIKGSMFRVVGVFKFEASNGMDQAQRIYVPFSTYQQIFNPDKSVSLFAVTTAPGTMGKQLEGDILELLKIRQSIHPDDDQAFWVHNQEENFRQVQNLFNGIKAFIWLVGIGTLTAGIVGVSNIMIIVVKERTKEIGIRKAMGATPNSIVGLILQESIFITAVAGYFGLFMGVVLLESVNYALEAMGADLDFFTRPEVNFRAAITSLIILVVSGALAGLFPALRAAHIKPVDALKDE
ncbi:ABC transporter permease [Marinoscillum sp. 108]|uniref:ABC transporter permease n=1 Tax=Marinoscillum sp. 108 TaxID=2653151 RepID=UPI0012F303C0|nr:ABC transporter permease [Marinoscillum sp. 108]VXD17737.1 ABC transporter permease [Marinoscillum sp. 108]